MGGTVLSSAAKARPILWTQHTRTSIYVCICFIFMLACFTYCWVCFNDVCELISSYNPQIFVIEEVFYGKNVKSAMRLGQARGASMVAAASKNIPIYEYSARKVKQSITGNGNAHKTQVQFMVKAKLQMDHNPEPIDAADALAIALCHDHQFRMADL